MAIMSRQAYAEMFGPTAGDCLRLGDTSLLAEIEHDFAIPGDECMFGGGKSIRDGMGQSQARADEGALDLVIENAVIIDPLLGVVKGDIGVRNGRIVGIGKAGNPATMDGVSPNLMVGNSTIIECAEGMIVTPGAIDSHVHFLGADQVWHALSAGVTTMIGGGVTQAFSVDQGGVLDTHRMLRAFEAFPVNLGLFCRGSTSRAAAIEELIGSGVLGVKVHEDFGAAPASIDTALRVADNLDFQVQLHTDTLNESGFYENTMAAIAGRTIHMYHTEGAGGGHAPDIIRCNGEINCLPSSTNPTNPYTINTFDEHLDMIMVAHVMKPNIPEDVAHAESRIRRQSISAEDILHDVGAISMIGSDSQGMGRVNETLIRTWQLASKMKDQRGRLSIERLRRGDNERIKRFIAKYTINPAITFGISDYVGSLQPGKMADFVLWRPSHFAIKPAMVYKAGYAVWGARGDGAACIASCQPEMYRPQWGSFGAAPAAVSAAFTHPSAIENDTRGLLDLSRELLPIRNTRKLTKRDMVHNDACPDIRVDAQTFDVYVDGALATCEPLTQVTLGQKYMMR